MPLTEHGKRMKARMEDELLTTQVVTKLAVACLEVFRRVAIWTKQLKVAQFIMARIAVFVMYFQNLGYFMPLAARALLDGEIFATETRKTDQKGLTWSRPISAFARTKFLRTTWSTTDYPMTLRTIRNHVGWTRASDRTEALREVSSVSFERLVTPRAFPDHIGLAGAPTVKATDGAVVATSCERRFASGAYFQGMLFPPKLYSCAFRATRRASDGTVADIALLALNAYSGVLHEETIPCR